MSDILPYIRFLCMPMADIAARVSHAHFCRAVAYLYASDILLACLSFLSPSSSVCVCVCFSVCARQVIPTGILPADETLLFYQFLGSSDEVKWDSLIPRHHLFSVFDLRVRVRVSLCFSVSVSLFLCNIGLFAS